jgi:hypothetical protein
MAIEPPPTDKAPRSRELGTPTAIDGPRSRRLAARLRVSREAMVVARPFNSMIAAWKVQMAELGIAMTRQGGHRERTNLANEADALARTIYREQSAFADAAKALTASAEQDERIGDTRRALDDVSAAIELIRKMLARPTHRAASVREVVKVAKLRPPSNLRNAVPVRASGPADTAYVPPKFNR